VVASTLLSTAAVLPLLVEVRRHVQPQKVASLLLGSFLGIPGGIVLLDRIDAEVLKILVSVVVIAAAALLYFAPQARLTGAGGMTSVMVGILSGALRASTSMGGPPAILYLLSREREVEEFRSTILAFFLPMSLVTLMGLAVAGRITPEVLAVAGVGLPPLALGLVVGAWMRYRVPARLFRIVALAFLVAASVGVILSVSGS